MNDFTIGLLILAAVALLPFGNRRRKKFREGVLDAVLMMWTPNDPFTVRDLLDGGVLVVGRSGSGKSSASGRAIDNAVVSNRHSAGLICGAKPEDADDTRRVFKKARRSKDLIVFSATGPYRFNILDYLKGEDTRNVVGCLMAISETLNRDKHGSGGENAKFWHQSEERMFMASIGTLQLAGEPLTADNLHKFVSTAASSPQELGTREWKEGYHSTILQRAYDSRKDEVQEGDFQLYFEFWKSEYPRQDAKTRSNVLAGVMNVLSVFASGIVRKLMSGATNVSPDDILRGKWVFVDFPPSSWGLVGAFISAAWKYLTQYAVLKRKVTDHSPFVVIKCDEGHLFVNSPDQHYLAQSRSHRGCSFYLTQSVSSFYAAMGGSKERDAADSLLANFATTIVHACDPVTAKWAGAKLGRKEQVQIGGGYAPQPEQDWHDELTGKGGGHSFNYSMTYEHVLQDQEFQHNLRTGGPDNNYIADAIVIRSAKLFASGESYARVSWSQKG